MSFRNANILDTNIVGPQTVEPNISLQVLMSLQPQTRRLLQTKRKMTRTLEQATKKQIMRNMTKIVITGTNLAWRLKQTTWNAHHQAFSLRTRIEPGRQLHYFVKRYHFPPHHIPVDCRHQTLETMLFLKRLQLLISFNRHLRSPAVFLQALQKVRDMTMEVKAHSVKQYALFSLIFNQSLLLSIYSCLIL